MVVDYSKWDKLELSDDSDIEVHPNVDKKSFIRWKQRDIHEKREQMKLNIRRLEVGLTMNGELIERIQNLVSSFKENKISYEDIKKDLPAVVKVAKGSSAKIKPLEDVENTVNTPSNSPSYDDMIESLLQQVGGEVDKEKKDKSHSNSLLVEKLQQHIDKLRQTVQIQQGEYEKALEERSKHILSEDLHTGFDSTMINKHPDPTPSNVASKPVKNDTVQEIEVLNSPKGKEKKEDKAESDDDVKVSEDALEFSRIKLGEYKQCFEFLTKHPWIINEKEKDGLMMQAFNLELDGKHVAMRRTIHNALLLQYCATLGPDGVGRFFSKIMTPNHTALDAFMKDVNFTVNHVQQRCKVLQEEREAESEGVEQIQLHAVDPNTEIVVTVPPADSEDPEIQQARKIYDALDDELKQAVETRKLDEINKVLATMTVEQAEEIIKKFDQCGVLSIESKIYDADEWQKEHPNEHGDLEDVQGEQHGRLEEIQ